MKHTPPPGSSCPPPPPLSLSLSLLFIAIAYWRMLLLSISFGKIVPIYLNFNMIKKKKFEKKKKKTLIQTIIRDLFTQKVTSLASYI